MIDGKNHKHSNWYLRIAFFALNTAAVAIFFLKIFLEFLQMTILLPFIWLSY